MASCYLKSRMKRDPSVTLYLPIAPTTPAAALRAPSSGRRGETRSPSPYFTPILAFPIKGEGSWFMERAIS